MRVLQMEKVRNYKHPTCAFPKQVNLAFCQFKVIKQIGLIVALHPLRFDPREGVQRTGLSGRPGQDTGLSCRHLVKYYVVRVL